jgi:hypothetical protein
MEEQLYDREMYDYVARDLAKRYKYDDISEHIVDVMISVMMHRDGVRIGGGFVEAINNNNLDEACSRADDDCINYLRLFSLIKRFGYIR